LLLLPETAGCSGSEFFEIKIFARQSQVFNDVGNDSARHIAGMPGKRDKAVRPKRIRIVPMAASGTDVVASDLAEPAVKLAAVP
jgi:hypothetical protein